MQANQMASKTPIDVENRLTDEEEKRLESLRLKLTVYFLCTVTVVGSMDAAIVGACLLWLGVWEQILGMILHLRE